MIPERNSLVEQSTKILRQMIFDGEWDTQLPTEAQLKDRMQVGRNTVRAALAVLTKEGVISEGQPGMRRRILATEKRPRPLSSAKVVAFLAPNALEQTRSQVIFTVDGLRDHLAEMGYRMEIHTSKAFQMEQPNRTLENLVHKNPADLWVLHQSTRAMQEWFSEQAIPCLIHGSTHAGIELPCVDLDFAAITRHAVGQLTGKGHTHVAMMLPTQHLYGDEQGEAAFWEALQVDSNPGRKGLIIRIPSNDPEAVCKEFKRVMQQAEAPTGLILWRVSYANTILTYAQKLGLQIPRDLSVICMDDSTSAEWLIPSLARYQTQRANMISKLFRRIYQILKTGSATHSRTLVLPDWHPGDSVASLRGPDGSDMKDATGG